MNSAWFVIPALAIVTGLYAVVLRKGDCVGWWIGLSHGVLAIACIAGWAAAHDVGFAVAMGLLTVYAAAMCASEAISLARQASAR